MCKQPQYVAVYKASSTYITKCAKLSWQHASGRRLCHSMHSLNAATHPSKTPTNSCRCCGWMLLTYARLAPGADDLLLLLLLWLCAAFNAAATAAAVALLSCQQCHLLLAWPIQQAIWPTITVCCINLQ